MNLSLTFDKLAKRATKITGSYYAFISACVIVIVWGICGPVFKYSEGWQLVINTGTTIVTFLMVFIIQQSSNKDTKAIQLKLDEIIRAIDKANNDVISIEDLSDADIEKLKSKN